MSWTFFGTGADISVGVSSDGSFQISGAGKQICNPSGGDVGVIRETKDVHSLWNISSESLTSDDLSYGQMTLRRYFSDHSGRTSAAIHFFKEEPPQISKIVANVLTLPDPMARFFKTASLVVGRADLQYALTIHFLGLRQEGVESPKPSLAEFMHSDPFKNRPYFSDHITFNVQTHPG
jgi:hypothetical protein